MASYLDQARKHRDPRFLKILTAVGYGRRDMRADRPAGYLRSDMQATGEALDELRAAYQRIKGRAPATSWGSDKLRRLIDEAQS